MWIQIQSIPSKQYGIVIPRNLVINPPTSIKVHFGGKSAQIKLRSTPQLSASGGDSYKKPVEILVTRPLMDKLCIPGNLKYQAEFYKDRMVIGPVIGLLLGNNTSLYNPRHMAKYTDRFGIYDRVGGLIYAFTHDTVDWKDESVYGLYYDVAKKSWKYGRFPLPDVIYRRNFDPRPVSINKLIKATSGRLFNSYRFSKYELFEYVKQSKALRGHLPPTELVSDFNQLKEFINKHHKVILKPVDLSRGRGICIIEKKASQYVVYDYRERDPVTGYLHGQDALEQFFISNPDFFKNYLVQYYLSLAKVKGDPYDIRIVMQKSETGNWKCSGIECRVAASHNLLTNISRGGYALSLEQALKQSFPDGNHRVLSQRILDLSKGLCLHLDTMGEHYAEFGIDIAIDENQSLWLIEANVFPSFKGFIKLDYSTYLSIRYTPLLYALSLTPLSSRSRKRRR